MSSVTVPRPSTDGTAAGTYSITPLGSSLNPLFILPTASGKLVFVSQAADGTNTLLVSDGTAVGISNLNTAQIGSWKAPNVTFSGASAGGKAFFTAVDNSGNVSVWSSDGTRAGTVELSNFGQSALPI